jgi:low temperature requirement protein LtrA
VEAKVARQPHWWQQPALRDAEEERRASWLELFVDLIFVAIIAACARLFAADVSALGFARMTIVFLPAWWVWIGLTVYNDRFETDDVSNRLSFFAIMLALGGLAVSGGEFFGEGFRLYALSYIAARLVIIGLWVRGGYHNPQTRRLTTRYALGFSVSVGLWLTALWVGWPVRLAIVLLAIAIDFATPLSTLSIQAGLPRLSRSHLPERFGLFVLIVLGESVVGVESVLAVQFMSRTPVHIVTGVATVSLAFCLWWLYFDHVAEYPPRPHPVPTIIWSYLHMALVLSLALLGGALQALIAAPGDNDAAAMVAACLAVAAAYVIVGLLEFVTEPSHEAEHGKRSLVMHGGAGVAAAALALTVTSVPATAVLAMLVVLGIAQIVYGIAIRGHKH